MPFRAIAFFIFAATMAVAAQPDYFPLLEGNQWIYGQTGAAKGGPIVVEAGRAEVLGQHTYHPVTGFPEGEAWLRMDESGRLLAYDPEERREGVWAAFETPEGISYRTEITPCNDTAVIESRNAEIKSAVGDFAYSLHIVYPPTNCADAGILEEYYLPYVGLLRRTVSTLAGPRTYELIYARLGGVTYVTAPALTFSLSLDRAEYEIDPAGSLPVLTARITLRNTHLAPFQIVFPSGQQFELVLKNEKGDIVYRWSDGKAFTLALMMIEFGHGEKNFVVEVPLADRAGVALPEGNYQAEAWLATMDKRRFAAAAGFEIRQPDDRR